MSFVPSENVEKIIEDYLERAKEKLAGVDVEQKNRLIAILREKIDKALALETEGQEVDRILRVLRRMGEPTQVITGMVPSQVSPPAKHSPLFWVIIVFFGLTVGLPVVLGAFGALVGISAGVLGIVIGYAATGLGLALGGLAGMIASIIAVFAPDVIYVINGWFGHEVLDFGIHNSLLFGGIIGIMVCGALAGIGVLMLFSTRYIFKGMIAVLEKVIGFIRGLFKRGFSHR